MLIPILLLTAAVDGPVQELPPGLDAMIRESHAKERKTIVNVAKRTYPQSTEAIDALVRRIEADEKKQVAKSDFLEGFAGEVTLGGYLSTGNTNDWGLAGSVALTRKGTLWTHNLDIRVDLKDEDGERTDERVFASYTLRRVLWHSRWFAFGRLRFEHDEQQGINARFGQAVGMGYQLVDAPRLSWDVMAGPALRQTNFAGEPHSNTFGMFARTKFAWALSDTIKFTQDVDAVVDGSNNTLFATTAITTDLYGNLAFRLSFIAEIETDPPPGKVETETYTRASLVYDF